MLQRRILDAFGEYERLIIGQRTKAALKAKRTRGERAGNLPFGYALGRDGQTLTPHVDEQRALCAARAPRGGLHVPGDRGGVNRQGFTTRRGTTWRHQYVAGLAA